MFTGIENGFLVILKSFLVESGRLESTRFIHTHWSEQRMCYVSLVSASFHPAFYVSIIHIMNVSGLAVLVSVL